MGIFSNRETRTVRMADRVRILRVGDFVRLPRFPPSWEIDVGKPHLTRIILILRRCVGRVYRVDGFDNYGQIEINVYENGLPAPDCCYETF